MKIKKAIKNFFIKKHSLPTLQKDDASEVEFYLIDSFEIYHFLPLYEDFINADINAKFIAEPNFIHSCGDWFDYDKTIAILQEFGVDYRTLANENAKFVISTQESRNLSKYKNKKVRLSYSAGLAITHPSINSHYFYGYDYLFVHGNYEKDIISSYVNKDKIYTIGYPRYKNLIKNPPQKKDIKAKYNIYTDKPLLVYLPTWDENSSICKFGDKIKSLNDEFFVITKPHHCTLRLKSSKKDLEKCYEISSLVLVQNQSLEEIAILSDYALIDAKSASCTEILYLNKEAKITPLSPHKNIDTLYVNSINNGGGIMNSKAIINDPNKLTKDSILNAKNFLFKDISYFYDNNPNIQNFADFFNERCKK